MKLQPSIIAFIAAGLLAGYLTGRRFPEAGSHAVEFSNTSGGLGQSKWDRDGSFAGHLQAIGVAEKHDFRALLRAGLRSGTGDPEESRELERLDSAALRDLLVGLLAGLGDGWTVEGQANAEVLENATAELYRRDGESALEWAAGLKVDSEWSTIFVYMVKAAVAATPEIAKKWVDRVREVCGNGAAADLDCEAIISATGRSAEELLRVHKLYGDRLEGFSFPQGSYADDFDFQLLFSGMPSPSDREADLEDAMAYWAAKDQHAAWAEARDALGKRGKEAIGYFEAMFNGIAVAEGDRKAAAWVAAHLEDVPFELREEAMRSLIRKSRLAVTTSGTALEQLHFSPEAREQVNAALHTP